MLLRKIVCTLVERIRANADTDVVPMTSDLFHGAVNRYRLRIDKSWGLTDCASFLIMEQEGLTDALSADRDFQQAGFSILLMHQT